MILTRYDQHLKHFDCHFYFIYSLQHIYTTEAESDKFTFQISVSVLISPTLALYFACIDLIPRFAVSLAQLQDRLQPPATLNWISERKWMDEQRTQGKHRRYRKEALKTNGYQRDCASVTVSQSHFFKNHYVIKRHVCSM